MDYDCRQEVSIFIMWENGLGEPRQKLREYWNGVFRYTDTRCPILT